ncbi:MAG TPA: T9SS type A sorting domain-containing protein, partial [Puia sp.]|nr:T9SS type A sorting domain-containing protein [Puia sp.]
TGSATPVFNALTNQYEYTLSRYYRTNMVDTKIIYRLTVASTVANMSNSSCSYVTSAPKIVYTVNCNVVLPTSLVFRGQTQNGYANLEWVSSNESAGTNYIVERSDNDQFHFKAIGSLNGQGVDGSGAAYNFADTRPLSNQTYYRININVNGYHNYSKVVLLGNSALVFDISSLVNPFTNALYFDMTAPDNEMASFVINDAMGRIIRQEMQPVSKGLNNIRIFGLNALPSGFYVLQVRCGDKLISKPVIKRQN